MFGSTILDVAIGLFLMYLLLSLFVSAINEAIAGFFKSRAATLKWAVQNLLRNSKLVDDIYKHYSIKALHTVGGKWTWGRWKLPSYIPSAAFSSAFYDTLKEELGEVGGVFGTKEAVTSRLKAQENRFSEIADAVAAMAEEAQGDVSRFKKSAEAWFDQGMSKASAQYKRHIQKLTWCVGAVLVVLLNANTLHVVDVLYSNQVTRSAVVATAEQLAHQPPSEAGQSVDKKAEAIVQSSLPLGWSNTSYNPFRWFTVPSAILGWLLTAIAISFGAPFWFDTLSRFVQIRSTTKPANASPPEGSNGS